MQVMLLPTNPMPFPGLHSALADLPGITTARGTAPLFMKFTLLDWLSIALDTVLVSTLCFLLTVIVCSLTYI